MSAVEAWQLKIPIRLALSSSEITSPVDVKPVYLLAPRHAYLPALAEHCLSFFQHVLLSFPGQSTATPWFEYEGLALNWSQPLGVLHDLLTAAPTPAATSATATAAAPASFTVPSSPWTLTVHYQNMPAAVAHSWQNAGTAKDHYFSSLKEAGYCCRGSDGSGAVMRLPGAAQDDLWSAVNKGDGQAVQTVLNQLKVQPTQKPGGGSCSVPVRVYIRQHNCSTGATGPLGVWENTFSTSRPVDVTQPDGSVTLLAHVMNLTMPQQFPTPQRPSAADGAPGAAAGQQQQAPQVESQQRSGTDMTERAESDSIREVSGEAAGSGVDASAATAGDPLCAHDDSHIPQALSESQPPGVAQASSAAETAHSATNKPSSTAANHVLPPDWPDQGICVLVCGVQPDWCTPLAWLYTHMRAADGFLYIVVHLTTNT